MRIDSLKTIMQRIRNDFNITPEQGAKKIRERMPEATPEQIQHWKQSRALEVMRIDGQERWFRKSVRNLWLLGDEFKQENRRNSDAEADSYLDIFRQAMTKQPDRNGVRDWRHVNITFSLDVKADAVPAGETLRVWMPLPYENLRQRNIKFVRSNAQDLFSQGSKHHTVSIWKPRPRRESPPTLSTPSATRWASDTLPARPRWPWWSPTMPTRLISAIHRERAAHVIITDQMRELAKDIVGD